jgi:hypothetical protein
MTTAYLIAKKQRKDTLLKMKPDMFQWYLNICVRLPKIA